MNQQKAYTSTQIQEVERLCAVLALVPKDLLTTACNEAAAYIRGFTSGAQSNQGAKFYA